MESFQTLWTPLKFSVTSKRKKWAQYKPPKFKHFSVSKYPSILSSQASFQQLLLSIKATLSKPSARKLPKSSWKVFSHSYHCFPQLRCVTQSSLSCLSMCHHPLPPYIPEPDFYLTMAGKVVMENKLQLRPHLAFLTQVKFCKIQQGTAPWISSQNSSRNLSRVVLSHLKPYLLGKGEGRQLPKLLLQSSVTAAGSWNINKNECWPCSVWWPHC